VTYVNWSDKTGRAIVADIILTRMLRFRDGNTCKKTCRTAHIGLFERSIGDLNQVIGDFNFDLNIFF
jgi:hypothetical protein